MHIFTNDVPNWKTGQTEFYSNNFRCTVESGRNFTQEMITCHTTNASVYFFIAYSRLNGVTATSTNTQKIAAFKEWLNSNPTEIEYQLKNTEYEEITNEGLIEQLNQIQNIQMQDGKTNIFWTGEVAPTMTLKYNQNYLSGDNEVIATGKQLFDKTKATLNRAVSTNNGGLYTDNNCFATNYIPAQNGTYTVNGYSTIANRVYGATYDINGTFLGSIATSVGSKTFTISNNAKYMRLTGFQSEIDTWQLEKRNYFNFLRKLY